LNFPLRITSYSISKEMLPDAEIRISPTLDKNTWLYKHLYEFQKLQVFSAN
jgi:hypothetical protein